MIRYSDSGRSLRVEPTIYLNQPERQNRSTTPGMGTEDGRAMYQQYRRLVPFILVGLLAYNLVQAVLDGTQARWITVGVIALVLALTLWIRARAADTNDPPQDSHP